MAAGMAGNGKLLQMQQKVDIQPPELQPSKTDEIEISPVRVQRNGLAGEVTFRCPPGKSLEESIGVLVRMLQHAVLSKDQDERGIMRSEPAG